MVSGKNIKKPHKNIYNIHTINTQYRKNSIANVANLSKEYEKKKNNNQNPNDDDDNVHIIMMIIANRQDNNNNKNMWMCLVYPTFQIKDYKWLKEKRTTPKPIGSQFGKMLRKKGKKETRVSKEKNCVEFSRTQIILLHWCFRNRPIVSMWVFRVSSGGEDKNRVYKYINVCALWNDSVKHRIRQQELNSCLKRNGEK